MPAPLDAPLPPDLDLGPGFKIRVTALSATDGSVVAGVNVSNFGVIVAGTSAIPAGDTGGTTPTPTPTPSPPPPTPTPSPPPPPPPPPPGGDMNRFGMYNNCAVFGSEADTAANWHAVRDKHMAPGVQVRREFNSGLPAAYNGGDVAYGITTFLSFKSPYANILDGADKARILAYVKTWPQGCYATWEHEPESPKKEFVADPHGRFVIPFQTLYTWVKTARPDVHFGPVHLAYQWYNGHTADPAKGLAARWVVPSSHADFYGCDWYNFGFNPPTWSLATATDWLNWHGTFAPLGRPLYLSEYGIASITSSNGGGKTDAQTAAIIDASRSYAAAHPELKMVLYWNGYHSDAGTHDIQLTPTVSSPVGRPKALARLNAWVSGT